jgi:predicted ATPase
MVTPTTRVAAAVAPSGPLFVGRRDALANLSGELLRAEHGEARIAWIVGDSGIGKTSLVRTFLSGAAHTEVIWVSADETETSLPFGVVSQVRMALGRAGGGPGPTAWTAQARVTEPDPFAVGAELLTELAARHGPTIFVVDDLQWADPPSLASLLFALRRLEGRVATYDGAAEIGFSGTLELLRLLEDFTVEEPALRPPLR